jgi:hypothetical protein
VERADGMFLWARLLTTYITSPALSLTQREDALEEVNLPAGLEEMYDKILRLILSDNASYTIARQIFVWLLYGQRELSAPELEQALITCRTGLKTTSDDRFSDFHSTVIITCGGLVERSSPQRYINGRNSYFRLIHASVREYLLLTGCETSQERSSTIQRVISTNAESHIEMAKCCLRYMTYHMPAQPLSGKLGVDPRMNDLKLAFPLLSYATKYWPLHLLASFTKIAPTAPNLSPLNESLDDLVELVLSFLHQPLVLMAWIEACYVLRELPAAQSLLEWSKQILSKKVLLSDNQSSLCSVATEAFEFSHYLMKLHELWGSQLTANPGCIWEEATAFTPSPLLSQNSGIRVHSLVPGSTQDLTQSEKELVKVSRTTSNGNFVAVLSIWPSR